MATPSSRRRVDGVEVDAAIEDERAVNLISTQVATLLEVARAPHLTSKGMPSSCTAPSGPWSFMALEISSHLEAS